MDKGKRVVSKRSIQAGNYRVSKKDSECEYPYVAWIRDNGWQILEPCETSDKAKAACELHYMRTLK